jgi:small conductance mechanosensitive channel
VKRMQFAAIWLLTALVWFPIEAQESPPPTEEVVAPVQAVAVEPVARDDEIAKRIQEILQATGWYENARVVVDDGVVFIDGVTASAERRAWAREMAQKTQDVVAVVNRVTVEKEVEWSFDPAFEQITAMVRSIVQALPLIVLALIVLPLAWIFASLIARLARHLMRNSTPSPFLRDILARAISLPVFFLGLYIVLEAAGLTRLAVSLVGGAGVLGIVIGFAFRDIAENFLASLLLSIRRPFRAGDYVNVAEYTGYVQSMNTRSTLLLSPEGNHVQVPNSTIFKNVITNFSTAPTRREGLTVGIGYDAQVAEAQEIIIGVLSNHAAVIADPSPLVLVDELGSSTVNLKIYYWFDGENFSQVKVKSAILRLIKKALVEANISMPDDAREIIFPDGVPVKMIEASAISETPTPDPVPIESNASATESEGDLSNERAEVEEHAGAAAPEDQGTDLLADKNA